MSPQIRYRAGYKYQLAEHYIIKLDLDPPPGAISHPFVTYTEAGYLVIATGYAWDGASGPTLDTPSTMRASLVHDALYQLMREGLLAGTYKAQADQLLERLMIEDGAFKIRAGFWQWAVSKFAGRAATDPKINPILTAP